jgi:hypothetical protein
VSWAAVWSDDAATYAAATIYDPGIYQLVWNVINNEAIIHYSPQPDPNSPQRKPQIMFPCLAMTGFASGLLIQTGLDL